MIDTFQSALEFYSFAKMMKDDLPDGQWEEVREIVKEFVREYGGKPSRWTSEVKEAFTEIIKDNYLNWL